MLIAVVCFGGAPFIMKLFVTDPEVIHLGVRFLRTVSLFYLMPAFTNGIQGFFRGVGDLKVTLVSSTINMLFRAAAAAMFVLMWKLEIEALPYSYVGRLGRHAGSTSCPCWCGICAAMRTSCKIIFMLSALSIFSRNFIFMDRAIPGRLRSAGNCIFTGGIVQTNGLVISQNARKKAAVSFDTAAFVMRWIIYGLPAGSRSSSAGR